jgi:hypothetical protein
MLARLVVYGANGAVDGRFEVVLVGEGLIGEMTGLEVAPYRLDVVESRGVFWQPFDGEPVGARSKRLQRRPALVDRAVVEREDDGRSLGAGLGAETLVDGVEIALRKATKSALRLLRDVTTRSCRLDQSNAPIMAIFFSCP